MSYWLMARNRRTRFGLFVGVGIALLVGMLFYGWAPLPIIAIWILLVLFAIRRRSSGK